jgi:hypothetical protein
MRNATLKTKLTILVLLGILVFASASEAIGRRLTTADPDLIFCKPQKSTSANLWTCYDYYDNEFKNLIITEQPKNAERTNKAP